MQQRVPLGGIRRLCDGVKDVKNSCTVSLWDCGSDGSLWVHPSVVINITPGSYTSNISTTMQNPEGGLFLITIYPSGHLVGVGNGWLIGGTFWFALWFMKGCRIPTENSSDPPISVVNETWYGCSFIRFLGMILPRIVVSSFGIFSR